MSLLLATQPLVAQIATDSTAASKNRPSVGVAGNGTPLINIVTPNRAGLSHNKYNQFNVGPNGAILNNSNRELTQSVIGGLIQGNSNLRYSGPARVILNEITGANRSSLRGALEVHGSSADVIVANPNGITCNGCRFINTPRVTLSTGTPSFGADGSLASLIVNGGSVEIGVNGADLSAVNAFDIVSRSISIGGPIAAGNDLNLIAGRNSYAYRTGLITPLGSDGKEPGVAIDSSLLGGMYAGRIRIVSTDRGSGVNMRGQMVANARGMTLSANGRLTLRKANAKGRVTARSTNRRVVVEDTLFSDDAIVLEGVTGVELKDEALVAAKGDLHLKGQTVSLGRGALAASGVDENGVQGDSGSLSVTAETLRVGEGRLAGAGVLEIIAALIDLSRGTDDDTGSLTSRGAITLITDRIIADNSGVQALGALTIRSAGVLMLTDGVYRSGGELRVEASSIASSADLQSANTITISAISGSFANTGEIVSTLGTTASVATDLTNSGDILSDGTVALTAGGVATNSATGRVIANVGVAINASAFITDGVTAAQGADLTVNVSGDLINAGQLVSFASAFVNVDGAIDNSGTLQAADTLNVNGLTGAHAGDLINRSTGVISAGAGTFQVASLSNDGTLVAHDTTLSLDVLSDVSNTGSIGARSHLDISLAGDLTVAGAGRIETGGEMSLTGRNGSRFAALDVTTADGAIIAGAGLAIAAAEITNAGQIAAVGGPLVVELDGDIDNTGVIYSGTSAYFYLDGDFTNRNGDVITEDDIVVAGLSGFRAGHIKNISGNIEAVSGDVILNATSVANIRDGQFSFAVSEKKETTEADGERRITTTTTEYVTGDPGAAGAIFAGGDIWIDADTVTNEYSGISADGNINIIANSVNNTGRYVIETTKIVRQRCDGRIFGHCIDWDDKPNGTSTETEVLENFLGTIIAGGTLTAVVTGDLENNVVRGDADPDGINPLSNIDPPPRPDFDNDAGLPGATSLPDLNANLDAQLGRPALFEVNLDPNAPYLVETRADFVDPSKFLGSDYYLGLIGYSPDGTSKRYGDAYAENRLVRDQLFELTGSRYLAGYQDAFTQMKALYDNAVDMHKALGLTFGNALSPAQMAALTKDIVWLEYQTVRGQRVLVPRLYLSKLTRENIAPNGARIAGDRTNISADRIHNSGLIGGWSGFDIATWTSVENVGGTLFSNGDVTIDAGLMFINASGIVKGRNIAIGAVEFLHTTAVTRDVWFNGYSDRAHQIARIAATGNLIIDVSGSVSVVGGDLAAGNNLIILADGDVSIEALALERAHDYRFKRGYDKGWSLTHYITNVEAGGDLTIGTGKDLRLVGVNASAGRDATLSARDGDVTISSVQDRYQRSYKVVKKSGWGVFKSKSKTESDSAGATTKGGNIAVGGDLTIKSDEGDVSITASKLKSGGKTHISAEKGKVALLSRTDEDFKHAKKDKKNLVWQSNRDKGHYKETIRHVEIDAGGGLKITAGKGVIAEVKATGSLSGSLDALAQKPGMAWVKTLRDRDDVTWRKVQAASESWDYKAQGLTEVGAALVALAVTAVSAGTLSSVSAGLAGAFPAGMQATAQAAIKAGLNQLVSSASVSLINNRGNLGAALKELGSSNSMKSLATAIVTAGLTQALTAELGHSAAAPGNLPQITRNLQRNLVHSVVRASVGSAITGENFADTFVDTFKNVAVNDVLSATHATIGDLTDGTGANDLPVANLIAHALVGGLAAEATGGEFAAGAASGLASATAAQSGLFDGLSEQQIAVVSQLIGATAALVANGDAGDVYQGATTAQSAAFNNYLTHAQIKEFEQKMKACKADVACKQGVTVAFVALSEKQNQDLANCASVACIQWHTARVAEARGAANTILNPYIEADPRYTVQLHALQSTERVAASAHIALARTQALADAQDTCGADAECIARVANDRFDDWVAREENKQIIAAATGIAVPTATAIRGVLKPIRAPTVGRVDRVPDVPENVPYFRVQGGGTGPKVSQHRITTNSDGSITINSGCSGQLCISVGNADHAIYFLTKKRPDGSVVVFDIDRATHNRIMEAAVPQRPIPGIPRDPNAPKIVDPNQPGTAIELPRMWASVLERGASNSRTLTPEQFLKEFGELK
ncbi:MAG: DUF637 domain-containing protein [Pseudomonadota bacterium]